MTAISISTQTVLAAAAPTIAGGAAESAQQQQMSINDPITVTSIYYGFKPLVVYPARWLLKLLMLISRPIWYILQWLAWPFISLANGLWSLVTLPYVLIIKFEAVLTFLFVATLIGGLTGLILYATSSFTTRALGLEESQEDSRSDDIDRESDSVRSVADFRASRKAKKEKGKKRSVHSPREEKMFQDLLSRVDYLPSSDAGPQSRIPLSTQTILEEDDSSSFEQY